MLLLCRKFSIYYNDLVDFSGETATCLFNFPHENDLLVRVLPGTMLSLDEQCKRDRGTTACFVSNDQVFFSQLLL